MTDSEIKIFYSWQSDLPGSQTRYLIQDSIESVVKAMRDAVEIIADRDTKGEFGSPDIAQTIFAKIDDCDIFVADVSVINKYFSIDEDGKPTSDIKTAPNPNVLLELGYAAQALGWENVICIINTDFGIIDDLPFDIGHRRLTPYSLKDKSKAEVKKELTEIIIATVMNVLENRKGFSLNETSLDKFLALSNSDWKFVNKNSKDYTDKYVFNKTDPEYVIRFLKPKGVHNYPYSSELNIFNGYEKNYKGKLQIFFHSVVIFEDVYYFMRDCEYKEDRQRYLPKYSKIVTADMKYYLLDSIQGKLIRILNKGKLNFYNGRKYIEYGHYLVFYNVNDLESFAEFIIKHLGLDFKLHEDSFPALDNLDFRINELFSCDDYTSCFHKYVEIVKSGDLSILPQNFQKLLNERNYLLNEQSNKSELIDIVEKAYQFQLYLRWRNIADMEYGEFVENMQ